MTQQEHLNRIKAKCQELLSIAEKRTPGKWASSHNVVQTELFAEYIVSCNSLHTPESEDDCNAAFIASCAGAAEAGWRATIAAIDVVLEIAWVQGDTRDESWTGSKAFKTAEKIIAAWPQELL